MSDVKVNTVLGPISPSEMGVTLPHEHITYGYPGWEGDQTVAPLDREQIVKDSLEMMDQLKAFGVKTFVDATPNDGGRFPEILREISVKRGVNRGLRPPVFRAQGSARQPCSKADVGCHTFPLQCEPDPCDRPQGHVLQEGLTRFRFLFSIGGHSS